jgi:hypothetical protein
MPRVSVPAEKDPMMFVWTMLVPALTGASAFSGAAGI